MTFSENKKGHLAILAVNIIFGINTPIAKDAMMSISPYALTFFRFVFSAIIFWILSFVFSPKKAERKDIFLFFFAAIFGTVMNLFLNIVGLEKTTPTNTAIVVSTTPIFTMIMAAVFIKEPLTFKKALGVAVGLCGALILILSKEHGFVVPVNNSLGIVICMLGTISYAVYLTIFSKLIKRNHPLTTMKWMFLFGTIIISPFTLKQVLSVDYASLTILNWVEVAYVVLLATCLNYMLIPFGQKRIRPTTLSMYNYVQPIVTTIIAILVGMDFLSWYKVLAAVLVFSGVYIVNTSRAKDMTI
ncbi:MAG: DMT family transporter [Bacteroidales bacterium]|nr:DMT family transporter [Candidatus Scybalousia scybalohippi]